MVNEEQSASEDLELAAMGKVYAAMKDLDKAAQLRVLDYVTRRLSLVHNVADEVEVRRPSAEAEREPPPGETEGQSAAEDEDGLEGVSPIAQKWMRRNSLTSPQLSKLFTLGLDEIDLVAKSVPGGSKRAKMRSVLLLSGVASYLSSGTAKVAYDKLKELTEYYKAYDGTNFGRYLKDFASDASGSKESGYSLTGRGLAEAATLVAQMTQAK